MPVSMPSPSVSFAIQTFPPKMPTEGKWTDPSGLFGIERGADGMLRAIAGDRRSEWAVTDEAAEGLVLQFMPDGEDIQAALKSGSDEDKADAFNEAHQFPHIWDMQAAGATMMALVNIIIPMGYKIGIFGLEFAARPDGLIYLVSRTSDDYEQEGEVSEVGATPNIAATLLSKWEGMDAAADLAARSVGADFGEVAKTLMRQWDIECADLMVHQSRTVA